MREEKKPNTLRGYESHWRHLRAWCETEGWEPTPADPYVVARFLIHRYEDDGLAAGSVTQAVQAIAHYHRDLAESLTEHRVVKKTMAGLRRRAQRDGRATPKQARGLTTEDLRRIRETACRPRPWGPGRESEETARTRGRLEISVIATMRDALLRRGEASALEWRDVMFREDGTGRVTIPHQQDLRPGRRPLPIRRGAAEAL